MISSIMIFSYGAVLNFIGLVFLVVFGQVSVRRFRKNPEIKPYLGISLMSGWDIVNVGFTLALPLWLNELLTPKHGDFINADYKVLRKHAKRIDFILAKLYFYPMVFGVFMIFLSVILDEFGFLQ